MTNLDVMAIIERHSASVPVPVFDILKELGLGPGFQALNDNISSWIEKHPSGRYGVVINSIHAPVRQRFTAAHELGHYIYHRDLLGAGVGDTRAYRADGTPFPNSAIRAVHERQANSFAANLLMPIAAINALRDQGVILPAELAYRLQVSEQAMCIRLGVPYHG